MISITTGDGLTHYLDSAEAIALTPSPNTRAALQAAYDAGNWEDYIPPEQAPEIPPDWQGFRLALLQSQTFRAWSEALPATWREDLKLAAIAANPEAVQATYDYCKTLNLPGHTAATEWQALAAAHSIPVTF